MRILVLGGTRFLGPPVVRQLIERGHDVTMFHRGTREPSLLSGLSTGSDRSPELGAEIDFDNLEVEQETAGDDALPVTVLRLPVIYGESDVQRRLAHYVRRMDAGRPVVVLDTRLARLRLSRGYVENVAAAVVLGATDERARGRTYNVAEPVAYTELEWAAAVG